MDKEVSRRMFDFVYAMFGKGRALLPKYGIGAIAEFLASEVGEENLRLNTEVEKVDSDRVITAGRCVIKLNWGIYFAELPPICCTILMP